MSPSLPTTTPARPIPSAGDTPPVSASAPKRFPFTQDQIAIALTFAKSKPQGSATEDYLARLQTHIKQGVTVQAQSLHQFDSFGYWRDECDKLLLENRALKEKIFRLEHSQPRNTLSDPDQSSSQEGEGGDAELNSREAKDASDKRNFVDDNGGHHLLKLKEVYLHPVTNDPLHKLNGHILKLGRSRKGLEKLSKSTANMTEIDELANFASEVLSILDSTISDCFLAVRLLKTTDGNKRMLDILRQISDQIILSFLSSFSALNELCRTILGRNKRGKLIYQMTMFFNKSLDLLHTLSSLQVEHEEMTDNRCLRRKRVRAEETEYAANKYIARTLAAIVYNLEWNPNQPVHSELLEGILYVVLEHTGRLLSEAVFDEHVAASKNPANITDSKGIPVADGLSKYEMRYVIQILQNTLGGRDKKDLFLYVLAAGKKDLGDQERLSGSGTISVPPSNLLAKAKVLLQSTLLKTALGCNELETLKLPSVPADALEFSVNESTGKEYGSDWFLEAVWALIGWDLMV